MICGIDQVRHRSSTLPTLSARLDQTAFGSDVGGGVGVEAHNPSPTSLESQTSPSYRNVSKPRKIPTDRLACRGPVEIPQVSSEYVIGVTTVEGTNCLG